MGDSGHNGGMLGACCKDVISCVSTLRRLMQAVMCCWGALKGGLLMNVAAWAVSVMHVFNVSNAVVAAVPH